MESSEYIDVNQRQERSYGDMNRIEPSQAEYFASDSDSYRVCKRATHHRDHGWKDQLHEVFLEAYEEDIGGAAFIIFFFSSYKHLPAEL